MKWIILVVLSSNYAFAQAPVLPSPVPQWFDLKQFLQLTDAQYVKLLDNQLQYQRTIVENQRRIFQLQNEISAETSRPRPDPVELGTRYTEIEMICRQFSNEAKQLSDQNRSMLTDAQKTRLKTLEDAAKLIPIIAQAQSASLLDPNTGFAPQSPTTGAPGTPTIGVINPIGAGCQQQRLPLPL